ncbi:MAG: L-aspartate oxidase [Gemmatimonadota bacterium]|nr:MAG: L-aspartate oxidase [Gemmatimonadota bacterium]
MAVESDFLIIGSGIAGLSFALNASQYGSVTVITKKENTESNTNYAQGGIATVIHPQDSFELHVEDTLKAGAGLCDREAVEILVREGPDRVQELIDWGVRFSKSKTKGKEGAYALAREGGHSIERIIYAQDLTGREIERALVAAIKDNENIRVFENHMAIDLITEHHFFRMKETNLEKRTCFGVYALNTARGNVDRFLAKMTMLSTGGTGQVYQHSTNPAIATGDGIVMSYRAGAKIANLEFMQFHPTTLYHPDGRSFLISEAVRGYGGILRTKDGETFMENYHPKGCLAPRDIVARAIDHELKRRGDHCVYLDVTHLDGAKVKGRFPNIYEHCRSLGIDMTQEPIPVVPAAHYMCGGVLTDLWGQTSIERLFASGEVTCTGVHGANRLASNSLLEALVFSHRALGKAVQLVQEKYFVFPTIPEWQEEGVFDSEEWVLISHDREEIQRLMWDYVGIVRSDHRLNRALRRVRLIAEEVEAFYKKTKVTNDLIELRNIATVSELIIRCALYRRESRGLHFTTDCPQTDDSQWRRNTILTTEGFSQ